MTPNSEPRQAHPAHSTATSDAVSRDAVGRDAVSRDGLPLEDLGRLLLRIALGGVLFAHGLQKYQAMGVDQVGQFFTSLGIPAPAVAAAAVTVLELVGGALIVLGVLVRPVAILAAVELLVAAFTAHAGAGFYADAGGWELPVLLAVSLLALAALGGGRFSAVAALTPKIPALLR